MSHFKVAGLGSLKRRRELVENVREVVPVALDLFQLGLESAIAVTCDTALCNLLRLALVDYRDCYTDTRREHLVRRDISSLRDGNNNPYRSIICLFCARVLATRCTTRESYRIAELMIETPTDKDRDISIKGRGGCLHVKLAAEPHRQMWCVADVADAIRPHVVVCELASLGRLQVPKRPDAREDIPVPTPLFDEMPP